MRLLGKKHFSTTSETKRSLVSELVRFLERNISAPPPPFFTRRRGIGQLRGVDTRRNLQWNDTLEFLTGCEQAAEVHGAQYVVRKGSGSTASAVDLSVQYVGLPLVDAPAWET